MLDVVCMKGLAITSRKHFHHSNRVGISITNYGITERKPSILRKVFNELKYVKISMFFFSILTWIYFGRFPQ
jgi:hypothetical protein